ncbi:AAA family ATPase [Paenibacillus chitinolyticus]|uniref:AAA family ATPase n=1 Tax=Paenibacillus chitinolyticus TaxID=79263 RepID=UPI001C48E714|nr:AAA family ATPase [Paenibacillus chitinolyticus]MBV6716358.1 ATP-binding protein [Paenibacillus chitinolyticus]
MELLYLWVDHYNGLFERQGFNFGGPFRFQYNTDTSVLTVKPNNHHIPGFFSPESDDEELAYIGNVTAIVGQNGAGKSSLLDLIKRQISTGHVLQDTIVAVKDTEGNYAVYFPFGMELTVSRSGEVPEFKRRPYISQSPKIPAEIGNGSRTKIGLIPDLQAMTSVYFSNIFDLRGEQTPKDVVNLSTNHLLSAVKEDSQYLQTHEVAVYRCREIERQLHLLNMRYHLDINLPFAEPETLSINFTYEDLDELPNSSPELSKLFERMEQEVSAGTLQERLLLTLVNHIFVEICNIDSDHYVAKHIKIYNIAHGKTWSDRVIYWLETVRLKLERGKGMNAVKRIIGGTVALYRYLALETREGKFTLENQGLRLPVSESDTFESFFSLYARSLATHEYAVYDWRDLSSGEQALLSMYARFKTLMKHDVIKHDHILIMIDEGELYFHPEWQKSLLLHLLQFFAGLFRSEERRRNVQIMITSNSPFIVSDLPASNIIFLRKSGVLSQVVDGLDDHKQTFASNIHTLLAHSFFMENGLIGEFAKSKINEVIDLLVHGKTSEIKANKERIEKTIHLIGEPVIKAKLISMLNDRIAVHFLNIEDQISDLQRQIDELRGASQ